MIRADKERFHVHDRYNSVDIRLEFCFFEKFCLLCHPFVLSCFRLVVAWLGLQSWTLVYCVVLSYDVSWAWTCHVLSRILSSGVVSVFLVSTFHASPLSCPLKPPLRLLTYVCTIISGFSKLSYLLISSLLSSPIFTSLLSSLLVSPFLSSICLYYLLPILSCTTSPTILSAPISLFNPIGSIVLTYLLSYSIMNFVFSLFCTRLD